MLTDCRKPIFNINLIKKNMTIFAKPLRKNIRSTIVSGKKGRVVLQKSKRRSNIVRLANLASRKNSMDNSSPLSSVSLPSTDMSSSTQESMRYKKHGVSFDDLIEDNTKIGEALVALHMKERKKIDTLISY